MRKTELIDKENCELNIETFFKLLPESIHDNYYIKAGTDPYDRSKQRLIVESWDCLAQLNAAINGWDDGEVVNLWNSEDLNSELNKAETELEKTLLENPEHLGTVSRLESRIKKLLNLSSYKRWMSDNSFKEISLEDFDFDTGFDDEYDLCCNGCNGCQNIVRTSPDSYQWSTPLFVDCEGYACEECVEAGEYDEYVLEEYKNVAKSIPAEFDLNRLGLIKINEYSYQNGWHEDMDDSPEPIIEKLNAQDVDVWFKVYPSQFNVDFDVYVKEEDEEKSSTILKVTDAYQGHSSSERLNMALKSASKQLSELPDGKGIKYAKCNADGTAETRLVSKEEFVKGIKD